MSVKIKKNSIGIDNASVLGFVKSVFDNSMHLKRVESLANAALGLLHSNVIGWWLLLIHFWRTNLTGKGFFVKFKNWVTYASVKEL